MVLNAGYSAELTEAVARGEGVSQSVVGRAGASTAVGVEEAIRGYDWNESTADERMCPPTLQGGQRAERWGAVASAEVNMEATQS